MRYALLLPLLLSGTLLAGCAGALEGTEGRPNAIVVDTGLAPAEAYRRVATAATEAGYALVHSDADLRAFTTDRADRGRVAVAISGHVDEAGRVTLRGTYVADSFGDEAAPIVRRGMSGSWSMRAWDELASVASRLPGTATEVYIP